MDLQVAIIGLNAKREEFGRDLLGGWLVYYLLCASELLSK